METGSESIEEVNGAVVLKKGTQHCPSLWREVNTESLNTEIQ